MTIICTRTEQGNIKITSVTLIEFLCVFYFQVAGARLILLQCVLVPEIISLEAFPCHPGAD